VSNVAIKGGATGTATYTIEAPTGNTDRTLVLPDEAGTVLTSGTAASSIPGYGNQITAHSQFRLINTLTAPSGDINVATNFEEVDDALYSGKGSPISLNGVNFEFDVTGLYLCLLTIQGDGVSDPACIISAEGSSDGGSNYDALAIATYGSRDSSGEDQTAGSQFIMNVTNTTNFRLKLVATSFNASSRLAGNTSANYTSITFIRLGDSA